MIQTMYLGFRICSIGGCRKSQGLPSLHVRPEALEAGSDPLVGPVVSVLSCPELDVTPAASLPAGAVPSASPVDVDRLE
jgi:hypothetical protein